MSHRPLVTQRMLIASGAAAALALALFMAVLVARGNEHESLPPLLPGDFWLELAALHQAAADGRANLLEPAQAKEALVELRVYQERALPRLEPEARLIAAAALGTPVRPLTLAHFEHEDGTRFTLFTVHDIEVHLPEDSLNSERFEAAIPTSRFYFYRLEREGVQLVAWRNTRVSHGRHGGGATKWMTIVAGGPDAEDPFWSRVFSAQRR